MEIDVRHDVLFKHLLYGSSNYDLRERMFEDLMNNNKQTQYKTVYDFKLEIDGVEVDIVSAIHYMHECCRPKYGINVGEGFQVFIED